MVDDKTRRGDDPSSEVLATGGLMTMLGAVLATVLAIVTFGQGNLALAGTLGVVAVMSLVLSLVCFFVDSNRADAAPLPFPSWLRTDTDATAELPAAN